MSVVPLTLLDLPKEIIIKIIGQDIINGITLKDRKSLRATCKSIEQLVSECDLQPTPFWRTLALDKKKILFGQRPYGSTRRDNVYEEVVICRRLFRSAHLDRIDTSECNFKSVEESNHVNVSDWMERWNLITCDDLDIRVASEDYDARIFEIIRNITPRRSIYLDMRTTGDVDEAEFAKISSVPKIIVSWNWHGFTYERASGEAVVKVSDSLVLLLARKHRSLGLECSVEGVRLDIEPATIWEIVKIVLNAGHSFKAQLAWHTLKGSLELVGVNILGGKPVSADPSVNVRLNIRNPFGRAYGYADYTIKKGELAITISNFVHEPLAIGSMNMVEIKRVAK